MNFRHQFVEYVPERLDEGVLYISTTFATVVHLCASGCGAEVVTPLSPSEWEFTFDGRAVSLAPSVGNWSLPCRSHYWIVKGQVRWARDFSDSEVAQVRRENRRRRDRTHDAPAAPAPTPAPAPSGVAVAVRRWAGRLKRMWRLG